MQLEGMQCPFLDSKLSKLCRGIDAVAGTIIGQRRHSLRTDFLTPTSG